MDPDRHYALLFAPIEERIGAIDSESLIGIVGFDAGGPVSLSSVGAGRAEYPAFITCELSVREDQRTEESPPFEILMRCNDQEFAWNVLTALGDLSLQAALGPGHIVHLHDLATRGVVGVVLEEFTRVNVAGKPHALLQAVGVSGSDLRTLEDAGPGNLLKALHRIRSYPNTVVNPAPN